MKALLLAFLLLPGTLLYAQTCHYNDLSATWRFIVRLKRVKDEDGMYQSGIVKLSVINKQSGKVVQEIRYRSEFLLDKTFRHIHDSRSYTTGKRSHSEIVDNDYGDVIVADFNFDGKEDIAITGDSGGNGGPVYNFYLQDSKGRLVQDSFLTRHMEFFPARINKNKRTLTTLVHANAYQNCETTYRQQKHTGRWQIIKRRFVDN